MTLITPEKIAELRVLLAEATPGPWIVVGYPYHEQVGAHFKISRWEAYPLAKTTDADASLIAALRNAAPALLDEIERLRASEQQLMRDLTGSDADHDYNRVCSERDCYRDMVKRVAMALEHACDALQGCYSGHAYTAGRNLCREPKIAALLKEGE